MPTLKSISQNSPFKSHLRGWLNIFVFMLVFSTINCPKASAKQSVQSHAANVIYYLAPATEFFLKDAEKMRALLRSKTKRDFKIELVDIPLITHTLSEKQLLRLILPLVKHDTLALVSPSMDIGKVVALRKIPVQVVTKGLANPRALGIVNGDDAERTNITGYSYFTDSDDKRLELLRKLAPNSKRIGLIHDSYVKAGRTSTNNPKSLRTVRGAQVFVFDVQTTEEALGIIARSKSLGIDSWHIPHTPITYGPKSAKEIVNAVNAQNLPAIYDELRFVKLGGLAAYESVLVDSDDIWIKQLQLLLEGIKANAIPFEYPRHHFFSLNSDAIAKLKLSPSASILKTVDYVFPCSLRAPLTCRKTIRKKY